MRSQQRRKDKTSFLSAMQKKNKKKGSRLRTIIKQTNNRKEKIK